MISKKKISLGSQQTEADSPRRFVRKNSQCSLSCRSASFKKLTPSKVQTPHLLIKCNDSSTKMQTQSQKFDKKQVQVSFFTPKRCSQSVKLSILKVKQAVQQRELNKRSSKLQESNEEVQSLRNQCKKLKLYLDEQREKRKIIEQQMRLSHIQIKRIQRRLQKYKHEKELMQKERQQLLKHVEILQNRTFDSQTKLIYSYRLKIMEEEVERLRQLLDKNRSLREKQLIKQIEQFSQQKYNLSKQINAGILANSALTKQMEEMDQQLQEVRIASRQKIIRSIDYIDLRQRYKLLLVENRELKQELQHMIKLNNNMNSQSRVQLTLLTVSNDSVVVQ